VAEASAGTISQLAERNREYEDRFGFIFIVCASGKSPDEMLAILSGRIDNEPRTELRIASEEQRKITRLRLEKLLNP
jgi:2-oxo-4-hydroxy-4-carboxy-5-ureidoimidazoline decarboxylase